MNKTGKYTNLVIAQSKLKKVKEKMNEPLAGVNIEDLQLESYLNGYIDGLNNVNKYI